MKYRKKPIVIDAVLWEGSVKAEQAIRKLAEGAGSVFFYQNQTIGIDTLEGTMLASLGDWIIRGIKGEIYPCKPDIFEATYEDV